MPKDLDKKINAEIDAAQYDAALKDLDTMQKFAPIVDMAWVYGERGYIYLVQRKYDAAVIELSNALKINPNNATYYNNRGLSYEHLHMFSEAESDYTKAINLEPENSRRFTERAAFYLNTGKLEDSLLDTEQAISLDASVAENYL